MVPYVSLIGFVNDNPFLHHKVSQIIVTAVRKKYDGFLAVPLSEASDWFSLSDPRFALQTQTQWHYWNVLAVFWIWSTDRPDRCGLRPTKKPRIAPTHKVERLKHSLLICRTHRTPFFVTRGFKIPQTLVFQESSSCFALPRTSSNQEAKNLLTVSKAFMGLKGFPFPRKTPHTTRLVKAVADTKNQNCKDRIWTWFL